MTMTMTITRDFFNRRYTLIGKNPDLFVTIRVYRRSSAVTSFAIFDYDYDYDYDYEG